MTASDDESRGRLTGKKQRMLDAVARQWKTPHGFQNTDASGKTAGGGGEFAKQVMAWQTPATDSFRSRGGERKDEQGLDQQARMWRTPDAPSGGGVRNRKQSIGNGHQTTIAEQAEQWPTPQTKDTRSGVTGKIAKKNSRPLCEVASQYSLPVPQTSTHGPDCSLDIQNSLPRQLNPKFVEILMGLPLNWTDPEADVYPVYAPWATASCQWLRRLRTRNSEALSPPELALTA